MPRFCVCDERGWLVPAKGTMARIVYDVLAAAEQCEEEFKAAALARVLGTSTNSVQVMASRIRCGPKTVRRSQLVRLDPQKARYSARHDTGAQESRHSQRLSHK